MAVFAAVGSFNVTLQAATNTVVVSGLVDGDTGATFTPTVVLFFWNGRTESTDTIGRATMQRGFGVATDIPTRWAVGSRSADAAGSAITSNYHTADACIAEVDAAEAIVGLMDIQSFDSGGFTLVIDDAFVTDLRVGFLALGGSVVATTGVFTAAGTAPVTQSVSHGVGSTPAAILFAGPGISGAPPGGTIDAQYCLGAMSGDGGEGVLAGGSNDGANTMQAVAYALATECYVTLGATLTAIGNRAEFSSIDSSDFTINWLERGSAARVFWLALGGTGVRATVGNLLTQTDTTTGIEEVIGFRPKGLLFASAARAASTTDTVSDHDHTSVGAAASPSQRATMAALDEDGIGTSEVTTACEFDAVYANISTASAIQGLMDLKAVGDTGFTCIMDDADPSQAFVWYLAVGALAVASASPPVYRVAPFAPSSARLRR